MSRSTGNGLLRNAMRRTLRIPRRPAPKEVTRKNRRENAMKTPSPETKKHNILEIARDLAVERFTPAEVEQIRRQLVVRLGAQGKTAPEYIAEVFEEAGLRVSLTTQADAEDLYEEEFRDLLHFATLEDAEMCLVRLDELWRKFRSEEREGCGRAGSRGRAFGTAPRGDDRAQPARGRKEARGEAGSHGVVRDLA